VLTENVAPNQRTNQPITALRSQPTLAKGAASCSQVCWMR